MSDPKSGEFWRKTVDLDSEPPGYEVWHSGDKYGWVWAREDEQAPFREQARTSRDQALTDAWAHCRASPDGRPYVGQRVIEVGATTVWLDDGLRLPLPKFRREWERIDEAGPAVDGALAAAWVGRDEHDALVRAAVVATRHACAGELDVVVGKDRRHAPMTPEIEALLARWRAPHG